MGKKEEKTNVMRILDQKKILTGAITIWRPVRSADWRWLQLWERIRTVHLRRW